MKHMERLKTELVSLSMYTGPSVTVYERCVTYSRPTPTREQELQLHMPLLPSVGYICVDTSENWALLCTDQNMHLSSNYFQLKFTRIWRKKTGSRTWVPK